MDAALLAALAEPNRLRIVELLNAAPRAVGEIAVTLGLRQPQVTKHLHTLERAGLVTMHPLGQRRIYALDRRPLRELAGWLDAFHDEHPSEAALDRYRASVQAEQSRAKADAGWAVGRTVRLRRTLGARPSVVWRHWTRADLIRRWWSPEHFTVVEAEADPVPGGVLRIVMAEGDGTRHEALGRYVATAAPRALSFELAPLGPRGRPLLQAIHHLRLSEEGRGTRLSLTVRVTRVTPAAAPAVAGLRLGWAQLLDELAAALRVR